MRSQRSEVRGQRTEDGGRILAFFLLISVLCLLSSGFAQISQGKPAPVAVTLTWDARPEAEQVTAYRVYVTKGKRGGAPSVFAEVTTTSVQINRTGTFFVTAV